MKNPQEKFKGRLNRQEKTQQMEGRIMEITVFEEQRKPMNEK